MMENPNTPSLLYKWTLEIFHVTSMSIFQDLLSSINDCKLQHQDQLHPFGLVFDDTVVVKYSVTIPTVCSVK